MVRLLTERLELVPCPLPVVEAVTGGEAAGLAWQVGEGWPQEDLAGFLPTYGKMLREDPDCGVWGVWLMIEPESQTIIGDIGFTGPPDDQGRVEIGYSILPAYRRRGLTAEAGRALVEWAFSHPQVTAVWADTDAANTPSHGVLEKVGFRRLGAEGHLLKWEIRKG